MEQASSEGVRQVVRAAFAPTKFNEEELIAAIREVADRTPAHIYRSPAGALQNLYAPDENNPCGCGIGAALAKLGIPAAVIASLDALTVSSSWGSLGVIRILRPYFHDDALYSPWAATFQDRQDLGYRWADAVIYAEDHNNRD